MGDSAEESINGKSADHGSRGPVPSSVWVPIIVVAVGICLLALSFWADLFRWREDRNFAEGMTALANQKWSEAVTFFGKSLESNPGNAAAHVGRSRAYLYLEDLDRALEEADRAVKLDPGSAQGFGQRGIVEKLKGLNEKALDDFSQAVKLNPGYFWAYSQIADLYMRQTELEKALENVNRALSLKADFVEGLRLRAVILTRLGKCKEAFDDFTRAATLRPDDAMSLQDKAWFLLTCPDEKLQDSHEAMELAQKAFTIKGKQDPLVLETLAEAHFRQGDPLKAAEYQKQAIELQQKKCPDGKCLTEMRERLQKYELTARQETRRDYEILPLDGALPR